ncbi:MAG: hypothetical protein NTU53_04780, partial [Planctomycetota bacterium]|nr:hypothetical protein [Planctomycetota bacterium]
APHPIHTPASLPTKRTHFLRNSFAQHRLSPCIQGFSNETETPLFCANGIACRTQTPPTTPSAPRLVELALEGRVPGLYRELACTDCGKSAAIENTLGLSVGVPAPEETATFDVEFFGDVVLPTRRRDGSAGPTLRGRCVANADEPQRVLLNRPGLKSPERLRRVEETEEAMAKNLPM